MRSFETHAGPNFRAACDVLGVNAYAQRTMLVQSRSIDTLPSKTKQQAFTPNGSAAR